MTKLAFGYHAGLPDGVTAAWGARLIVQQDGYTDLLWNRQGNHGDGDALDALHAWLNGGALKAAREKASALLVAYEMRTREAAEFVLYEDDRGRIVGNTNASAGYLYIAAWLFNHEAVTA